MKVAPINSIVDAVKWEKDGDHPWVCVYGADGTGSYEGYKVNKGDYIVEGEDRPLSLEQVCLKYRFIL